MKDCPYCIPGIDDCHCKADGYPPLYPEGMEPKVSLPIADILNTPMKYPHATLDGKTYDIYDIAEACGVTSPPLFNAFKKIIRRGNGAKTERQDLEEVKQSVDRYQKDKP